MARRTITFTWTWVRAVEDGADAQDLDVKAEISGKNTPARFDKAFGNYLPGDSIEVEIVEALDSDGVDCLDLLSKQDMDELEVRAEMEAGDAEAEAANDAAEARADARGDR